ncbi:H-NS histone family protein [Mameliella alba]|nr:H-NS histone family protein [Antarctobacter heliothermus]MBY6147328.1 H-NS histone family protein [Mameliella alba]MCA0957394.1 H-NS histone family protein [Mameliella alba]
MVDINLDGLSLEELKRLEKDVAKAIKTFEARKKNEARAAAEAMLRDMGFTLSEIVEDVKASKKVSAPKYQHPENPEKTWTGRGRKPNWFVEALDNGKTEEDLLIST